MNIKKVTPPGGSPAAELSFPTSRAPHRARLLLYLLLLAIIVAGGVRLYMGRTEEPLQYSTQPAKRGNLVITVTATGNLEPTNQVDVGCELSGTVQQVLVDYNARVKKGEVLARLDTSKLKAEALQSRASLESAKAKVRQVAATVKETQNEYERLKHLFNTSGSKGVSRHDMDAAAAARLRAVADAASAEAEVSRTRAVLEANETDLAKSVIVSPFNGIVLTRSVEPGQTVAAAMTTPVLFTLAEDLSKMKLPVDVDEADVGKVMEGQTATFTVDAYADRRYPADIRQVRYGAKTKNSVVTYKAVLGVDNSDLSLRPGMTATAEIIVKKVEDGLLIPNAALRFTPPAPEEKKENGGGGLLGKMFPHPPQAEKNNLPAVPQGRSVWALREGRLASIPVRTGESDGNYTVVLEGAVEPDMPLITGIASPKQ